VTWRRDLDFRNDSGPHSWLGRDAQNSSELAQAFFHPYRPKTANALCVKPDSIVTHAEHQPVKTLFQFYMDRFGLSMARSVLQRFLRDPV